MAGVAAIAAPDRTATLNVSNLCSLMETMNDPMHAAAISKQQPSPCDFAILYRLAFELFGPPAL